jgi:hypothetical protein
MKNNQYENSNPESQDKSLKPKKTIKEKAKILAEYRNEIKKLLLLKHVLIGGFAGAGVAIPLRLPVLGLIFGINLDCSPYDIIFGIEGAAWLTGALIGILYDLNKQLENLPED